ncbi:response regulator [Arenicella chitinivorans]|uniref:Response regulator n=1 Tax=Arenicella chitinivorans TaxID=1329800 RepID=A0A918RW71_9GAMM|nr:response regulator [Arenicella chitinivorans]GHA11589.1 response regulator [Arenicella chitinivorans]
MSTKTILVVDDSKTDFLYVKNILDHGGYKVAYAPSGADGIQMSKDLKPDLILMDVVMPEMNGFQATRAISRELETADIPILMLSSKSQQTDKVWAERQGATDYLVKPANPKLLLSKIKSLLN